MAYTSPAFTASPIVANTRFSSSVFASGGCGKRFGATSVERVCAADRVAKRNRIRMLLWFFGIDGILALSAHPNGVSEGCVDSFNPKVVTSREERGYEPIRQVLPRYTPPRVRSPGTRSPSARNYFSSLSSRLQPLQAAQWSRLRLLWSREGRRYVRETHLRSRAAQRGSLLRGRNRSRAPRRRLPRRTQPGRRHRGASGRGTCPRRLAHAPL